MRVTGRDDDMMIIRGVNVFPSQIEAVLVGLPGVAPHYQIVLTREGALDAMTVEVETGAWRRPGGPDGATRPRSAHQHQVPDRRHLRRRGQSRRAKFRARKARRFGLKTCARRTESGHGLS